MQVLCWYRYSPHEHLKGGDLECVLPTHALPPPPPRSADWLSARGGCYSSGGGLLLGQLAGGRDQQGSRDVHAESGEGQPGPREHLRDDGGETGSEAGAGTWLGMLAASCPSVMLWAFSPFTPFTPGLELRE